MGSITLQNPGCMSVACFTVSTSIVLWQKSKYLDLASSLLMFWSNSSSCLDVLFARWNIKEGTSGSLCHVIISTMLVVETDGLASTRQANLSWTQQIHSVLIYFDACWYTYPFFLMGLFFSGLSGMLHGGVCRQVKTQIITGERIEVTCNLACFCFCFSCGVFHWNTFICCFLFHSQKIQRAVAWIIIREFYIEYGHSSWLYRRGWIMVCFSNAFLWRLMCSRTYYHLLLIVFPLEAEIWTCIRRCCQNFFKHLFC